MKMDQKTKLEFSAMVADIDRDVAFEASDYAADGEDGLNRVMDDGNKASKIWRAARDRAKGSTMTIPVEVLEWLAAGARMNAEKVVANVWHRLHDLEADRQEALS